MKLVGKRIVDGVDVGVGEKFFVGAVGGRNAVGGRGLLRLHEIAGRDGYYARVFPALHGRNDFPESDGRGAENSPAEFLGHGSNDKGETGEGKLCV